MNEEIKTLNFIIPALASSAVGSVDVYGDRVISGKIKKVVYTQGTFTNTGNLYVAVSGTGESILQKVGGLSGGNSIDYPIVYPVLANGTTGSPSYVEKVVSNHDGIIRVYGNALGSVAGVDTKVDVYYEQ